MRRGGVDEASAVSRRVGKLIGKVTRVHLRGVEEYGALERLWRSVGQIKNRRKTNQSTSDLSPEELNDHFAKISEEPRNFICVAAVNRAIYKIHGGIC